MAATTPRRSLNLELRFGSIAAPPSLSVLIELRTDPGPEPEAGYLDPAGSEPEELPAGMNCRMYRSHSQSSISPVGTAGAWSWG
jgi:hypothetical protein